MIGYKEKSLGASISRVPGRMLGMAAKQTLLSSSSVEKVYGSTINMLDKDVYAFSLFENKDLRLLFVLNNGHIAMPQTVPIFKGPTLSEQLDQYTAIIVNSCVQIGLVTGNVNKGSTNRIPELSMNVVNGLRYPFGTSGDDKEDALYVLAVPGMEIFLKMLAKMTALLPFEDAEPTDAGKASQRTQEIHKIIKNQAELDVKSFESLSVGSGGVSGERNLLAFLLRYVQKGSELHREMSSLIKLKHPKLPAIKLRKAPLVSYHFLQELPNPRLT